MSCTSPKFAYVSKRHRYGEPQQILFNIPYREIDDYRPIMVPCGKCPSCRLSYSRDWANRCVLEMEYHKSTMFLTLTYDDEHLPFTYDISKDTGEATPVSTLYPRDLQLFLKRLRRDYPFPLRFFGCGEYGSQTLRPHYHLILFGLDCQLDLLKKSSLGDNYYTSPLIAKFWSDPDSGVPLGNHLIAPATWKTCAYVARYILKKQVDVRSADFYSKHCIEPPFIRCSRRPGIGYQYFVDHPDCMQYSRIACGNVDDQRSFSPPAYYKRMFKDIDPVSADWYSIERESFIESQNCARKLLTDKDIFDILKDDERRALNITNRLPRDLI